MNAFDDDAMRYEKRSMVNDYLDQMKGKGFKKVMQSGPQLGSQISCSNKTADLGGQIRRSNSPVKLGGEN